MKVPFVNLRLQHEDLMDKIRPAMDQVFDETPYVLGPAVGRFEKAAAKMLGAPHAVGVNSGTDALLLSLKALGVGPGDEVIVPTFTFMAVAEVVVRAGARPVFVDVDPLTYNMAIDSVTQAVTPKTRAVVAVHAFGYGCDLAQLLQLANAHGVFLIEDVAQSMGARIGNRYLGTMGIVGCLSFDPVQNLGAVGDGGMVVTHNDQVADRIRQLRDHGRAPDGTFAEIGFNSTLDPLQAAILKVKLDELEESIADRVENARFYDSLLAETDLVLPEFFDHGEHTYNCYTVQAEDRDALRRFLAEREIGTEVLYPRPLHLEPCLNYLGYKEGDFPVAELLASRVLSLPVYPGMKRKEVEEVALSIHEFLATRAAQPAQQ